MKTYLCFSYLCLHTAFWEVLYHVAFENLHCTLDIMEIVWLWEPLERVWGTPPGVLRPYLRTAAVRR